MTSAGFRRMALALDGVIERAHMGHPDFRVNGRIFATLKGDNQHGDALGEAMTLAWQRTVNAPARRSRAKKATKKRR